jgi:ADP-ribose pyrophosphatase YjhB (NUDIX family)
MVTTGVNVIILGRSEVLLTQRIDNGKWCLPGGMVELGETLAQACGGSI